MPSERMKTRAMLSSRSGIALSSIWLAWTLPGSTRAVHATPSNKGLLERVSSPSKVLRHGETDASKASFFLHLLKIAIVLWLCLEIAEAFSQQLSHIDTTVMDVSIDPCQDFYGYACRNFAVRHPLMNGQDYKFLTDMQRLDQIGQLASYLSSHGGSASDDSRLRALRNFYTACVNADTSASAEKALMPLLHAIDHYRDSSQLPTLLALLNRAGAAPFFGISVGFESNVRILELVAPELSLRDADDYREVTSVQETRIEKLREHIKRILTVLGESNGQATGDAKAVVDIEIPAADWTPPSFDLQAFAAENFGRIGVTVSHELVHGFDDKGRQRDESGRIGDWWTAHDIDRFREKALCFVYEYEQFGIDEEHHESGELTLGENIADNGGLHLALLAFLSYVRARNECRGC